MRATIILTCALCVLVTASLGTALEHFPSDTDLTSTIATFTEWFEGLYIASTRDGQRPTVRLAEAGEGMRLGVFATRKIPAESKYLSIPLNAIIGDDTIFATKEDGIGNFLHDLAEKGIPKQLPFNKKQAVLAIFLLWAKFLDPTQFWRPYIDLIPESHDTPAFFEDHELDMWLKGTTIPTEVRRIKQMWDREYGWLDSNIFATNRRLFPSALFTKKNWYWAGGILNTRMIWWDNAPHLVPMLDMINCRQGPDRFADRVHSTVRENQHAVTRAPWTFAEGEQVFENYGQPNPTYFLYHGFVMEPNQNDCAQVPTAIFRFSQTVMKRIQQFRLYREFYCIKSSTVEGSEFWHMVEASIMSQKKIDSGWRPKFRELGTWKRRLKVIKAIGKAVNATERSLVLKRPYGEGKRWTTGEEMREARGERVPISEAHVVLIR